MHRGQRCYWSKTGIQKMDFSAFKQSLKEPQLPEGLTVPLQALWHDGKGAWETAHRRVQDDPGKEAAWVHAYLHRKEGDASNAGYWYRRAGRQPAEGSLEEEWTDLARALLEAR